MRVLITGGTGFIGSRLALSCLERGYSVRVLARARNAGLEDNKRLIESSGAVLVAGSVTEEDKVSEAVQGADVVYHLAAAQHEANVSDRYFWDVNVTGTRNVLDASVAAGVKRFVHQSTIGVFGSAADGALNEQSPLRPDNIYSRTKLEGENLSRSYQDKFGVVIVRPSESYGPGDRRLLRLFKAIKKKAFLMIGNGQNLHHPIYVGDLIEGLHMAADDDRAVGATFVLYGSEALTSNEMVETIARQLGTTVPRVHIPLPLVVVLARIAANTLGRIGVQPPIHPRRMDFFRTSFVFENGAAHRTLGFAPGYTFEQGVEQTVKWYTHNGYL